jgi:hypothetical protein
VSILAAALALIVIAQNMLVYRSAVLPQVRSFTPALEGSLIHWGRWLERNTPPDAVVATPDIGAIGYYSRRRVVDLAGLITPAMVPHLERETQEEAVRGFHFATFSRPHVLVDRSPAPHALLSESPYGAALRPLGTAPMANLGIARPQPTTYTFYAVDWAVFDSLRATR